MMENKIRKEFIKAHEYHLGVKPNPLSKDSVAAEVFFSAGYATGRNHPIEVSLEEAAEKIMSVLFYECQPDKGDVFAWIDDGVKNELAKAVLSLVPNCVVKE